jgi:4-hydroxybenzoate polyprenyltransferase
MDSFISGSALKLRVQSHRHLLKLSFSSHKRLCTSSLRPHFPKHNTKPLICYGSPSSGRALITTSIPRPELISTESELQKPTYTVPRTGILSLLPRSWVPYAELTRLDKPAGTIYLFFPCLFSTLLAAIHSSTVSPLAVLGTSGLFLSGAFIMRGAGCTINDLWDRNLDPLVSRTALRPLARRAITPQAAVVFTGFQLLTGLAILLQFPTSCLFYGIPSLILVATYPLAKRVTYYPQFVLGLTFSWGAIMGFPALGISLLADAVAAQASALLYASCVSWTVLYDMIYAHMDVRDDRNAGIKSIALRHENETKQVLTGLAVVQLGFLASAGLVLGTSPVFYLLSCGSAAATLGTMIWKVKLKSVRNCWWWFKMGAWFTGGGISVGMFAEYLTKQAKKERPELLS